MFSSINIKCPSPANSLNGIQPYILNVHCNIQAISLQVHQSSKHYNISLFHSHISSSIRLYNHKQVSRSTKHYFYCKLGYIMWTYCINCNLDDIQIDDHYCLEIFCKEVLVLVLN
jgi:hypothetical protein